MKSSNQVTYKIGTSLHICPLENVYNSSLKSTLLSHPPAPEIKVDKSHNVFSISAHQLNGKTLQWFRALFDEDGTKNKNKNTLWDLATFNIFLQRVKGDTPILQNRAKKNNDFLSSLGLHILWTILNVHPSIWNGHVRTRFDRDTFSSIDLITNLLRTKMHHNIRILEGFV